MIIELCVAVSIVLLILAILMFFDNYSTGKEVIAILFIACMTSFPTFMCTYKDEISYYEVPTLILKTNNITFVTHISGKEVVIAGFKSTEAEYWNSTNILIKISKGKNFYDRNSVISYSVVSGKE